MTFLELCKRLRLEGSLSGSGPTTVTSNNPQDRRLVEWTRAAWLSIQRHRQNWNFMWSEANFLMDQDVSDYAAADKAITDLNLWDTQSFLIYDTAVGIDDQNKLVYLSYRDWRDSYSSRRGSLPSDRPQYFTILPDNRLRFEPTPDLSTYRIDLEYKRSAQRFVDDADVPTGLPDDLHEVILWQALKFLASSENAPETMDKAEMHFDDLMTVLEREQLPEMELQHPTLA